MCGWEEERFCDRFSKIAWIVLSGDSLSSHIKGRNGALLAPAM